MKRPSRHFKITPTGFSLLEVVIGLGIIVTVLVGLVTAFQTFFRASVTNTERIQATFLLEEGIEIVRFLRDESWANNIATLALNTGYYPTLSGGVWTLSSTPTTTNAFTRTVTIHEVFRKNSDDTIVASTSPLAKTLDQNIVYVVANIVTPLANEIELSTYVTNLFNN